MYFVKKKKCLSLNQLTVPPKTSDCSNTIGTKCLALACLAAHKPAAPAPITHILFVFDITRLSYSLYKFVKSWAYIIGVQMFTMFVVVT